MGKENDIEVRRVKASELLGMNGFMSLAELVENLSVSESTIRRDLEILEDQGVIRRTRGGAVYVKDSPTHRLAFAEREMSAAAQKRAIAAEVAGLIPSGQTVILSGGTTCHQVAMALQGRRVSVITNCVSVASVLSADLATEVTIVGGYVYPRTGVALGPTAEAMIDGLHATQAVLSCAGVTEEGAFEINQMMAAVERKMIGIADETILAIDHSKFGKRAVMRLCGLDEVDIIVTDDGADEQTRAWLQGLGLRVIYAKTETDI